MFSSPWHLLLFDRLGVAIIGTLTIIGGKAVEDIYPTAVYARSVLLLVYPTIVYARSISLLAYPMVVYASSDTGLVYPTVVYTRFIYHC